MKNTSQKQIEPKKEEVKALTKKYTHDEVKDYILNNTGTPYDTRIILDKLVDEFTKIKNKNAGKKEWEAFANNSINIHRAFETESYFSLMESFNENYRGLIKEFGAQLVKDYGCKTAMEKALAEIITNAYIRIIDNSRRFNNCAQAGEYLSDERTKHLAMLSKQIDRANRQFLNALMTLKQLKAPVFEMNIKTTNAFVAQNQQINANNPTESNKNENIETK